MAFFGPRRERMKSGSLSYSCPFKRALKTGEHCSLTRNRERERKRERDAEREKKMILKAL